MKAKSSTFTESNLLFNFDKHWDLRAFDKQAYYKVLSGYGFKGVDFVGILDRQTPVLMEVKNYQRRVQSPKAPDIQSILGEHPELIDVFITKIEDTLAAIRVIQKSLQRKRGYRLAQKWNAVWNTDFFPDKDWRFWTHLHRLIEGKNTSIHLVLCLRTESSYPNLTATQILELKAALRHDIESYFQDLTIKFYIIDKVNNPYATHLDIREKN